MHEIVLITAQYLIVLPVLAFLYILWRASMAQRKRLLIQLIVSGLITLVLMKLAAHLHSDPRPFVRDHVTPYFTHSPDNGFPSDHTAYSALIGWLILTRSRVIGAGVLVVALLIGSARVIAGVHHAQDIIGGFLLAGLAVGLGLLVTRLALHTEETKE